MVTEWLVHHALSLLAWAINLLPVDPVGLGDFDLSGVIHLYDWLNSFLPVSECIELLVLSVQVLVIIGAVASAAASRRGQQGMAQLFAIVPIPLAIVLAMLAGIV